MINRRSFIGRSLASALMLVAGGAASVRSATGVQPPIPRWRGFNLTELASGRKGQACHEHDFEIMAFWGFNFVRLPCSYWAWSDKSDWMVIDDSALEPLDQAIDFGRQYNMHVNLCLHRLPGYCVNGREMEPFQLFDSQQPEYKRALDAATHHWQYLARRYQHISSDLLSFDLLNEPPFMRDQTRYTEIARRLIVAIRDITSDRFIFVDGADIGQTPVPALFDQRVIQSTRGYLPKMISHHGASWVPAAEFESFRPPAWPMTDDHGIRWDKDRLREELIAKWQPAIAMAVPVHVGEWGCLNQTPHDVSLSWMTDMLSIWREAGWGWALWNLRGAFGVLDSQRADVSYESFRGHQLDRQMLELLQAN